MTVALRIRRRLWVALAAIMAALPATAGAADGPRCEAMPAGCTSRDCCEVALPAAPDRAATVDRTAPADPCGCCVQSPTAPVPKPGQVEEERRVEMGRDVATAPPSRPGGRVPVEIAIAPDVGPPGSPIYLRTLRLRI